MLMWNLWAGSNTQYCFPLLPISLKLYDLWQTSKFLCLRCELPAIQLAISVFCHTPCHSASPVPCKQTPSIRHQYAACPVGEEEEQQRGGRREGWENKASIVVSPAGPGRAALAGASYVMWLAGPTSLFRAAAHTNPHWGTSPALEEEEETEGELWGNQWRRCDYKNFNVSSAPNRTHRHLPSQLHCWKITVSWLQHIEETPLSHK